MKPITLPGIEQYAATHTSKDFGILTEVAAVTHVISDSPEMMIGPVGGRLLEMLIYALQPRLVLEIGTFTGYSALTMAAVLPNGARIITCEKDPRHALAARRHIASSKYKDRITVEVGPALETIAQLQETVDFAFIDADKTNYVNYFEAVLPKLSDHGLIAVDNTLWNGTVIDQSVDDPETTAIRQFNDAIAADPRVSAVLLTVRDGVTLIRPAGALPGRRQREDATSRLVSA